jgi:hypothetical protein
MASVKQILLRVPDGVHQRLAARAAREGRSVNAVATELLDVAVDADQGGLRARVRARAAAAGMLREFHAPKVSAEHRREILESTRGLGPIADALIAEERDRP